MSRSLTRTQAIILGVIVLLGIGLLGLGLFAVGSRQWLFSESFHVRAGFDEIRGVEIGTRVRIQGIDAGEVVEVLPPTETGGKVMVRLRLKADYRHLVRSNATVQIVGEGMLGGKVLEIDTGSSNYPSVEDNALLASKKSSELSDVINRVGGTLEGIVEGDGTLGKLVKDPQAYKSLVELIDQTKATMVAFQRDAEAFKKLPIVGKYVEDPEKLLIRPQMERNRKWFKETDLFQSGRATLTAQGQNKLDQLAGWINGLKHDDSEVVVVAYAARDAKDRSWARTVTTEQATTVAEYLKDKHDAHKLGFLSSRKVIPLGMGVNAPLTPEREKLSFPRIEIQIFVPQRN